ncbi:MAG TPA: NAD(P)H-dependent oxidoreductase subunit E [Gemmatimonadetes bacterium]|nr:NAD(P)H-dependent oxidoreductase subunit E [Gemmatimonadota bacterium]
MSEIPFKNPGWAGNVGEYDLTEEQVRGIDFVGVRPLEGGHAAGSATYPYMLEDKHPEAPLFEGPYEVRFQKILTRYPTKRAALLPALNLAQEIRGHISPQTMDRVGELLELSPAYVRGVATFYTMYNKRPVGRHLVQVCTNISCNLCGGQEVLDAFLEHTNTEVGETSADGTFTVIEAECLAGCGFPTCVQINSRYFENVTLEEVPKIVAHLRESGPATESLEGEE